MRYKKVFPHIIFAILVGVFVLLNHPDLISNKFDSSPQNTEVNKTKETAQVLRVIDGDTIEVSLNNKKETVRLIGIDAPEIENPRKSIECFGQEASSKAKEILTGKTITLESDPTQGNRDKYQRFLRYVILENRTNFNKLMIGEGYAHEYTYQSNPYKYQAEFRDAERTAREENKGLWNESACKIP